MHSLVRQGYAIGVFDFVPEVWRHPGRGKDRSLCFLDAGLGCVLKRSFLDQRVQRAFPRREAAEKVESHFFLAKMEASNASSWA